MLADVYEAISLRGHCPSRDLGKRPCPASVPLASYELPHRLAVYVVIIVSCSNHHNCIASCHICTMCECPPLFSPSPPTPTHTVPLGSSPLLNHRRGPQVGPDDVERPDLGGVHPGDAALAGPTAAAAARRTAAPGPGLPAVWSRPGCCCSSHVWLRPYGIPFPSSYGARGAGRPAAHFTTGSFNRCVVAAAAASAATAVVTTVAESLSLLLLRRRFASGDSHCCAALRAVCSLLRCCAG